MDEMNQTLPEKPKTHMVMAIVSTVLSLITCTIYGILPGIVSIVFASQVSSKYNKGDYEGAQNNSKYAKKFDPKIKEQFENFSNQIN